MDIKNTKEVIVAANEMSLVLIKLLKDGIQLTDAMEFYAKVVSDEAFRNILLNAYDGIKNVPTELGDIDAIEATELGILQLSYIPKFVETLKA